MAKRISETSRWQEPVKRFRLHQGKAPNDNVKQFGYETLEQRLLLASDMLFIPYDINFDGVTDSGDQTVLESNYDPSGLQDNTYFHGDFNLDGLVDDADITVLQDYITNPLPLPTGASTDFNQFAIDNFGAEGEPLAYQTFGEDFVFEAEGSWQHVSANSVAIAFGTNLPARTYVEFGENLDYGHMTTPSERPFATHLAYLTGLDPATTYHYRYVGVDERGNIVVGNDRTVATATFSGAIQLYGNTTHVLDQDGATYLVMEDMTIDGTAFDITANNVTLDLGGREIVYNNTHLGIQSGNFNDYISDSSFGVRIGDLANITILNGTLSQGAGNDLADFSSSIGFNPIFAKSVESLEVAGVTLSYDGSHVGIYSHYGDGQEIHHNIFSDRGTTVQYRHGTGSRAYKPFIASNIDTHDNLVKRTRQSGLGGDQVSNNEIYVDSWDTNSFGISPEDTVDGNRIFGTGYHVIGIGWGDRITVTNNYIQLQGVQPTARSTEFGLQGSVNGIRLTQYGGSTNNFRDNLYEDNVIVVNIREGAQGRGVQFSSDPYVENLVFRNNIVQAIADDYASWQISAIVAQGLADRADQHLPIVYENNRLISNRAIVRFGDYYGTGSNHQFIDNTFVKAEDHPLYYAFQFDGSGASKNHIIRDATFEGGASIDDVKWRNSTSDDDFTVQWTLTVGTLPGAGVMIDDVNGQNAFFGAADSAGRVDVVLNQYRAEYGGNVVFSPHTVMANNSTWSDSVVVLVNSKQSLLLVPRADFDEDGDVDGADFLAWQRGYGTTGASLDEGDADSDTQVGQSDLVAWQHSYGTVAPANLSQLTSAPYFVKESELATDSEAESEQAEPPRLFFPLFLPDKLSLQVPPSNFQSYIRTSEERVRDTVFSELVTRPTTRITQNNAEAEQLAYASTYENNTSKDVLFEAFDPFDLLQLFKTSFDEAVVVN